MVSDAHNYSNVSGHEFEHELKGTVDYYGWKEGLRIVEFNVLLEGLLFFFAASVA